MDLCHKRFDAVLMNPPFGTEPPSVKDYIENTYPDSKNDLYAIFVERGVELLLLRGTLGAISSRTGMFLSSLRKWRENTLMSNAGLTVLADLGMGVLDTAMVETAAYCVNRFGSEGAVFLQASSASDKAATLLGAIHSVHQGHPDAFVFAATLETFRRIPGAPFAYWITPSLLRAFERFKPIEGNYGIVRVGLQTDDDFRFVRLWTEVSAEQIGSTVADTEAGKTWLHILKGDTASSFYADIPTVVNWRNNGAEVKRWITVALKGGHWSRHAFNTELYCAAGLSWSVRTQSFRPSVVPGGCIFTVSRYLLRPSGKSLGLLGLLNSSIATLILRLSNERFEHPKYIVGTVQRMPVPELTGRSCSALTQFAAESYRLKRMLDASNEFSHAFLLPSLLRSSGASLSSRSDESYRLALQAGEQLEENRRQIDELACQLYSVTPDEGRMAQIDTVLPVSDGDDEGSISCHEEALDDGGVQSLAIQTKMLLSWLVGVAFGRWDIRFATGEQQSPELPDPFASLPFCSPGMLQGVKGLPLRESPASYPLRINWGGVLIDESGQAEDIVRRVRDVIEVIWKDRAEGIENEACEIVGVKELRDYFRKSTKSYRS